MLTLNKSEIKIGDILLFKNGKKVVFGISNRYVLKEYYNEELKCLTNSDYDIVKVLRPKHKIVYEKDTNKLLKK